MPIPVSQLERWSHQGATTTAKNTYGSIRTALDRYEWSREKPEIYLQGSYKNTTNIRGNSDVDLVIQFNSIFLHNLTDEHKRRFGFAAADYKWEDLRREVKEALIEYYGIEKVKDGKKTIKLETSFLPADVVVSIQYQKYAVSPSTDKDYIEGIAFSVPSENRWVINYPKHHYHNGTRKNALTQNNYKPAIRMFKNARSYLIERGAPFDLAPSYFLECLLYNVPNDRFSGTCRDIFYNTIEWLSTADLDNFVCQNEQYQLFGSSPEQWSEEKAKAFVSAMVTLWNDWGK